MTYPAGIALKKATGKPLVVHVHSLEYDRSGKNVDPRIFAIERMGVTFADEVIVVNGERKWEFLAPATTAGMEEDPDLLDAIRDGIENGRLLLAVDCLDYLRRYDPDYTADLLGRWSRGSFTEGERSRSGWFSLSHFTNWAQKQI